MGASEIKHTEMIVKLSVIAPYDEPKLTAHSNYSCVVLTIRPPTERNGVILHYQVVCSAIRATAEIHSASIVPLVLCEAENDIYLPLQTELRLS